MELPPKGAGPQISGRFEEERPRPEAKAVSQDGGEGFRVWGLGFIEDLYRVYTGGGGFRGSGV